MELNSTKNKWIPSGQGIKYFENGKKHMEGNFGNEYYENGNIKTKL